MTLQQQIRANRRRTAYVILAFAALIVVFAAASAAFVGRTGAIGLLAFGLAYGVFAWWNAGRLIGGLTHATPAAEERRPRALPPDRERLDRRRPDGDAADLPRRRPGPERVRGRLAALVDLRRRHERPAQADAGARARGGARPRDLPHPQQGRAADDARRRARRRDRDHQRLRLPDGVLRRPRRPRPQPVAADRRDRRARAGADRRRDAADGAEPAPRVPRRRERRRDPQRPRGDGARPPPPAARHERGRLRRPRHRAPLHREPHPLRDGARAPSSPASSRRTRRSRTGSRRSRRQAASGSTRCPSA